MNVGDLMTRDVKTCRSHDSLDRAARIMWDHDCGCVPVVDANGKAVGMITDRDVCMAAYTQGRPLTDIPVAQGASKSIVTLREDDGLDTAEALMQKHQIRRIPVVDGRGRPTGVLSMSDLTRRVHTGHHRKDSLSVDALVKTMSAICRPAAAASHAHTAE